MGMTPSEVAEWNRKYGGGAGQMTSGKANVGASDFDIYGYAPNAGAAQAGGGAWADTQYNWNQHQMNVAATERNAYNADTNASRQEQGNSLAMLREAAMGKAPSRAELLSRHQMDQAASAQQSLAASARGPAALAMAQQQAAGNTARSMTDISANTSAMRADEMARARDSYYQGAAGMRGQDQARVGDASQRELGLANNQLGWGQLDQQGRGQEAQLGLAAWNSSNANRDNAMAREAGIRENKARNDAATAGTVLQTAGTAAAMFSDVRAKENVRPASNAMEEYLATLDPAVYTYNGAVAGAPSGAQFGPASAQGIASTQIGANVVEQKPNGLLAINGPAAIKAGMSADAHINSKADMANAKADAALQASRGLASLSAAPTVISAKPKDDWLGAYLANLNATNNVKGPR